MPSKSQGTFNALDGFITEIPKHNPPNHNVSSDLCYNTYNNYNMNETTTSSPQTTNMNINMVNPSGKNHFLERRGSSSSISSNMTSNSIVSSSFGSMVGLNPNAKEWVPQSAPHIPNPPNTTEGKRSLPQLKVTIPSSSQSIQSPFGILDSPIAPHDYECDSEVEKYESPFGPLGTNRRPSLLFNRSKQNQQIDDWLQFDWPQEELQQTSSSILSPLDTVAAPQYSHRSLPPPVPTTSASNLALSKSSMSRSVSLNEDLAALSLNPLAVSPTASFSCLSPGLASPSAPPANFYGNSNHPLTSSAHYNHTANSNNNINNTSQTLIARRNRKLRVGARAMNPGSGVRGIPVYVLTNFYDIEWPKNLRVNYYDIKILPETIGRVNRRVLNTWMNMQSHIDFSCAVYDGMRNLYSPIRFPIGNDELISQVVLYDEGKDQPRTQQFTLRIKRISEINMEKLSYYTEGKTVDIPREAIQVLEVLLRNRPSSIFTTIGRGGGSFYSELHNTPIANGLTVHQGWYQSVRPTFQKLLLNLDVSATSFYVAGPLLETVAKFFNKPSIEHTSQHFMDPYERRRLERFLRDISIEINYRQTGRKRYKIKGLSEKPASQTLIVSTGKDRMKHIHPIVSYFKDTYGVIIRYPWLPCVVSGSNNDCLLPMELCFLRKNQRHVGKLNDQQLADIVKLTAVMPEYRKERVIEGMRQLHGSGESDLLKSWGVKINPEMSLIQGRILAPPPLTFGTQNADWNQVITPSDGTWRIGRGLKFAVPSFLSTWSVAVFGEAAYFPLHTVVTFVKNVLSACINLGMEVTEKSISDVIVYCPGRVGPDLVETTLKLADERARTFSGASAHNYMYNGSGINTGAENFGSVHGGMVGYVPPACSTQLVICILAQKNSVYEQIKKVAETEMGLMTQCVIGKHVHVTKPSYAQNLALKINAKLGGVNSYIDPVHELGGLGASNIPTMLMGADVTHPQNGTTDLGSIAAVVGTVDTRFCEYRAAIRVHSCRRENLSDLEGMTCELFELYKARNGLYPRRILFFRDGIADAQFGDVPLEEIAAIKKACLVLGIPDAKLTFTIVNKRHHGRFFPGRTDVNESDTKGNILAGTVIDSGVTHPFEFDFYLTSHPGMQGTSKAAHYHVLHDDNKFSADDLQEITYRLCYNFARSTRAVSIVPPAYFAHLVAARARCYASAPGGSNSSANSQTWTWNSTSSASSLRQGDAELNSGQSAWLNSPNTSWGGISPSPTDPNNTESAFPPFSSSYSSGSSASSSFSLSGASSTLSPNVSTARANVQRDGPRVSPLLQTTMFFT